MSNSHSLERTSPKGGPFIGYCIKCGQENLTIRDMCNDECDSHETDAEALIKSINKVLTNE